MTAAVVSAPIAVAAAPTAAAPTFAAVASPLFNDVAKLDPLFSAFFTPFSN